MEKIKSFKITLILIVLLLMLIDVNAKIVSVHCESWEYKYKECPQEDTITSVRLKTLESRKVGCDPDCNDGLTCGYRNNIFWVNNGCRGWFDVTIIERAGCYKKDGTKANSGTLTKEDFDFYRTETGEQQIDPDASSSACACLSVSAWDSNGKCCGNDADDCGKITSGLICDSSSSSASWTDSKAKIGDIKYIGCSDAEFLSDGATWTKCDGTFKKIAGSSEYICIGKGRQTITECSGDTAPQSDSNDGKRISTGQSIPPASAQTTQSTQPTTSPTTTQPPEATIVADSTTIVLGQSTAIRWCSNGGDPLEIHQCANANTCKVGTTPEGSDVYDVPDVRTNRITVAPIQTTTYHLTCTGPGGTSTDSVTVSVS